MTGRHVHVAVDDVVAYWRAYATNHGFVQPSGRRVHHLTPTELESPVHISAGRYVADCPSCTGGAAACWIENPAACCLRCGTIFKPVWPEDLTAAVDVLNARPNPDLQHWHPARQTVDDLKAENLLHGVPLAPQAEGELRAAEHMVIG